MAAKNGFAALQEAGEAGGGGSAGKTCSVCTHMKPETEFSKKQWAAKAHSRKCNQCVESGVTKEDGEVGAGQRILKQAAPAPVTQAPRASVERGVPDSMTLAELAMHLATGVFFCV